MIAYKKKSKTLKTKAHRNGYVNHENYYNEYKSNALHIHITTEAMTSGYHIHSTYTSDVDRSVNGLHVQVEASYLLTCYSTGL